MSKNSKAEDSAKSEQPKRLVPKRQLSKLEKESRKRRIIGIIVSLVIAGVVISFGITLYKHYDNLNKPWHEPIVEVNGEVYDMEYFVKMLRLYQVDQYQSYQSQYAYYFAGKIIDYELMRQAAEEVYGITVTDDEMEEELNSQLGDNYDQFKETLEKAGLSITDYKQLYVEPVLLEEKVKEAIGNEEYPEGDLYNHVRVQAVLVGTKDEADEVIGKWGDFNQIVKDYSPTVYYPEDGYWLVMVTEGDGQGEEGQLYINAMLLATKDKAEELKTEIEDGGDFATLAQENSLDSSAEDGGDMGWMSPDDITSQFGEDNLATIQALALDTISAPISPDSPDDPGEWLPEGVEKSSIFEGYAFDDANVGSGVSAPIPDTTYTTSGGYWLVMVTEGDGNGEEGELYINAILLDSKDKAEEVAAEFDGSNFSDLAQENSLDSSADNGGDMGWMSQDDIETEFGEEGLAIINGLSQDEVSTPIYDEDVSKQSGYWVIEVFEKQDRELIQKYRDKLIDDAYNNLLEDERNSEENEIVNHLDDEDGSEKITWALEHI